jgi:hypothetical protein
MATLRENYRSYTGDARSIPLHLQSRFDPPLMDLFLASADEIREFELGEENILLGRVLGDVRLEMNRREMREEVRYTYPEAGGETLVRLGANWAEALASWLASSKESQALRERLAAAMKARQKTLNTFARKKELGSKLTESLALMKSSLELGVDDPDYQHYDAIRKRIVKNWDLPVDAPAAAIRSDAEVRFLQFARASQHGKGPLSPAIREMLERQRETLNLTHEQANALLAEAAGGSAESREEAEYRQMFEAFYQEGELPSEVRVLLIERQIALGLQPERARQIEAQVRERLGRTQSAGK